MTQITAARQGQVTPEVQIVAKKENLDAELIRQGVEKGEIVVVRNNLHTDIEPVGIGKGLRTKVNGNYTRLVKEMHQ